MNPKIILYAIVFILVLLTAFGIAKMTGFYIQGPIEDSDKVKIETNHGDIIIELYPEKAPVTVENFKKYVKEDFYSNTIFHRVIDGFMIQGGGFDSETDEQKPTNDPIKLESDNGLTNDKYTIAMARTTIPNSATSQFFINTEDNDFLNYASQSNPGYAVFGKVIEGMDVVEKIEKVQTTSKNRMENWPSEKVIIEKISFVK